MNNDFLVKYETELIDRTTKRVTEEVTEKVTDEVSKKIAKNLKDILPDVEIANCTGLSLKDVESL